MTVSVATTRTQDRARPTALRLWTMLALAGGMLALMYLQLSSIGIDPVLTAIAMLPNAFDTPELHGRVGETVALRLANRDTAAHSFDVDELQVHTPLAAGASSLVLFRPSAPGSYTFYCGVPGHREAGMVGTLIVEP